jgi:uncharacterized protein
MDQPRELAPRLRRLARTEALGYEVVLADDFRSRLLGLALLAPGQVGGGLLIPHCSSIHTVGMRFPLDVFFLDSSGAAISVRRGVMPNRLVSDRRAAAVLEMPGGETARLSTWQANAARERRDRGRRRL